MATSLPILASPYPPRIGLFLSMTKKFFLLFWATIQNYHEPSNYPPLLGATHHYSGSTQQFEEFTLLSLFLPVLNNIATIKLLYPSDSEASTIIQQLLHASNPKKHFS
ncbi:hypothetical protein GBA52_003521 [Prunus armeniaca]|nr:hypothetical protein GBA52_003521 [Prunus armeniaca]